MKLDQLCLEVRARNQWEAVDTGLLMAQRWWWQIMQVECVLLAPWLILAFWVDLHNIGWAFLALWAFKPVLERPILMIISYGIFGESFRLKQILLAFSQWLRPHFFKSFIFQRFSAYRGLNLPVLQLETLSGKALNKRLGIIQWQDTTAAIYLTFMSSVLELVMLFSIGLLLALMLPQSISETFFHWQYWAENIWAPKIIFALYVLAVGLTTPLYIACNFSLYLNRRIQLEAWDIEIGFRKMLQRRHGVPILLAVVFCSHALFSATPVNAAPVNATPMQIVEPIPSSNQNPQDLTPIQQQSTQIRNQITKILEGPDFHRIQKSTYYRYKYPNKSQKKSEPTSFEGIQAFMSGLAVMAEWLLWGLVLAGIVWVALRYSHWWKQFLPGNLQNNTLGRRPNTLFGLDVQPASLPSNIAEAAVTLWQRAAYRDAMSLLYRASLIELLQLGVPLQDSSTELECLQLMQLSKNASVFNRQQLDYFKALTDAWRNMAYGHQMPETTLGLTLCRDWPQVWNR